MKTKNINKAYIGNQLVALDREPDLIFEVEGTDVYPIWYNGTETTPGKLLRLLPDENGRCEVYFPEEITSMYCAMDPSSDWEGALEYEATGNYTVDRYYHRLKKIIGFPKWIKSFKTKVNLYGFWEELRELEYNGSEDIANWDISKVGKVFFTNNYRDGYSNNVWSKHLGKLDLRKWDWNHVDDIELIYNTGITELDISNVDPTKYPNLKWPLSFRDCKELERIKFHPSVTELCPDNSPDMVHHCNKLKEIPTINVIKFPPAFVSADKPWADYKGFHGLFSNCYELKTINILNTDRIDKWWMVFTGCNALENLNGLDLKSALFVDLFSTSTKLKKLVIKNIGTCDFWTDSETAYAWRVPKNTVNLSGVPNWGADSEENRKSLVDSLLTYSFDRASANRSILNILLDTTTLNRLTDTEKAAITAKGYNLIGK